MSKTRILIIIAGFLALTIGSFVYYVITWDRRDVSAQRPAFIFVQGLRPFVAETIPRIVSNTPLTPPPEAPTLSERMTA